MSDEDLTRPPGSGSVTRHGDRYRARLPRCYGRRSVGVFDTAAEAAEVLDAVLVELAARGRTGELLVEEWGERWLDTREATHKRRTVHRDRVRWSTRVAGSTLGALPVRDVTESDVREWLEGLRKADGSRPAPTTLRNALSLVRGAFDAAREGGIVSSNPAAAVRLSRPARRRAATHDAWTWLRADELDALFGLEGLPAMQRAAFALAAFGGLRAGEVWGLRWSDVDLERGVVTVARSFEDTPKSHASREVALLEPLRAALVAWRSAFDEAGTYSPRGLAFPARDGGHHSDGYDAGWARKWRAEAGIARRVRFHDLRHTCASHLLQGTWSPHWIARPLRLEEVRDVLGHDDIGVTQRYAHLCADGLRSLVVGAGHVSRGAGHDASHLGDSNPRPTVYETAGGAAIAAAPRANPAPVSRLVSRVRLEAGHCAAAIASGDPHRDRRALDLVAAVVELLEVLGDDVTSSR